MLVSIVLTMTIQSRLANTGQALIDGVALQFKKVRSVSYTVTVTGTGGYALPKPTGGLVRQMRGGYSWQSGDPFLEIANPKCHWRVWLKEKKYQVLPLRGPKDTSIYDMDPFWFMELGGKAAKAIGEPIAGKFGGRLTLRVPVKAKKADEKFYMLFDPKTKMPMGVERIISLQDEQGHEEHASITISLGNIVRNPKLTRKDFQWKPPDGWKKM
jgi:outer membrane lipoprotein-sorting protein